MSIESIALDLVRVEIKELKNYGINLAFAYEHLKKQQNALMDCIQSMVKTNEGIYTLMNEINTVLVKNEYKPICHEDKITTEISIDLSPKKIESKESEVKEEKIEISRKEKKLKELTELLNSDIEMLKLQYRAYSNLKFDRINTISDLTNCTEERLMKIKGMGAVSVKNIKHALANIGLSLSNEG